MVATPEDVCLRLRDRIQGGELLARSYVRYVDANIEVSYPEPIPADGLASEDAANDLVSQLDQHSVVGDDRPDPTGLAFDEDATKNPIGDGWQLVNGRNHGVGHADLRLAVIDTGANDNLGLTASDGSTRILDVSADVTGGDVTTVADAGLDAVADGDGHGSWVTECCAARDPNNQPTEGLLPEADLLIDKALADDGSGSIDDILRGVDHAIEHDAEAACMSLGSPLYSHALADAAERALESGLVIAAASGNDRYGTTFCASPSSAPATIPVTATTAPNSVDDAEIAYFANAGPHDGVLDDSGGASAGATPTLAAPGMELETNHQSHLLGTSMAAPCVAAAAGLLIADGVPADEVRDRLERTAAPMPNAGQYETANGLLDVEAALADSEPDQDQAEVRNDQATTRDAHLQAYSAARGGWTNQIDRALAQQF